MKSMFLAFLCAQAALFAASTPDEALKRLMEGNERYTKNQFICPDRTEMRRMALTEGQQPFAVICGCSDSRVPPEILFDQGVGDLFIVRVAGNVVGPVELDSIDYSAIYLHSSLIVVLGHENCGAIKAVLAGTTKDIEAVASLIKPNIQMCHSLPEAIKTNVQKVVDQLKQSRAIGALIKEGKINVVGGYYNLASGKVDFFTDVKTK